MANFAVGGQYTTWNSVTLEFTGRDGKVVRFEPSRRQLGMFRDALGQAHRLAHPPRPTAWARVLVGLEIGDP